MLEIWSAHFIGRKLAEAALTVRMDELTGPNQNAYWLMASAD